MSSKSFTYDSLAESDSIRLLLLEPGEPGDPIRCSLIHTSITECNDNIYEQYTALSCVWGSPENPRLISVGSHPFRITANLAAALDDLRDSCKPLHLWADAICIDQSNIRERNHQIKHMRDIFSLAQRTVVYLGQSTDLSSFVLERLHHWRIHGAYNDDIFTEKTIHDMAALHILSRACLAVYGRTRNWCYRRKSGYSAEDRD
ncbi:heterokaryon incompatibility protein-domain-containing protein [Rhexocercosporidium sp. MPI-PUGE-AT-0058]|nr:heterokaryon incompatibility protein-domain-containing protein [Rhexocercosporidium sp. MPI-PUGE-AT-0058]